MLNHDKRAQTVYLVNSSANSVTCGIELASTTTKKAAAPGADSDVAEGDNPYANFVAAARARAQALAAASTAPFSVQPAHVQIPAFQKVPLKIVYTPVHSRPRKGFSSGLQTGTDLHNYTAVIEFTAETKRVSRLPLKGKCMYNVAVVSPSSLQFQDSATSKCQLQFSMKNGCKTLPLWYCIRDLPAFFHVHPRRGTIPPEATGAFDISYKPKALGVHHGKVHVSVHTENGRLVEDYTVHVHGECDNPLSVLPKALHQTLTISDSPGKLASRKVPPNRMSVVPGLKSQTSKHKNPEDEFGIVKFEDMDEFDPGASKRVDALWLATNNMPATYTPTKGLAPELMKKIPVRQVCFKLLHCCCDGSHPALELPNKYSPKHYKICRRHCPRRMRSIHSWTR